MPAPRAETHRLWRDELMGFADAQPILRAEASRSGRWRRCKEAPPAAVRAFAAPVGAVRRRLRFRERNRLDAVKPIAVRRRADLFAWHHEAIAGAAAPFARGVAMAAARNPAVVCRRVGNDEQKGRSDEREPCKASEHGYTPFVVPARRSTNSTRTLPSSRTWRRKAPIRHASSTNRRLERPPNAAGESTCWIYEYKQVGSKA